MKEVLCALHIITMPPALSYKNHHFNHMELQEERKEKPEMLRVLAGFRNTP